MLEWKLDPVDEPMRIEDSLSVVDHLDVCCGAMTQTCIPTLFVTSLRVPPFINYLGKAKITNGCFNLNMKGIFGSQ